MEVLPWLVIAAALIWWQWFENREDERRRTAPERARRATRNFELDCLAQMQAEDWLRRVLIADLKQHIAREQARRYLREHYGIEPDPPPMPSLWPWPLSKLLRR